jgi:hypothetical protein
MGASIPTKHMADFMDQYKQLCLFVDATVYAHCERTVQSLLAITVHAAWALHAANGESILGKFSLEVSE